MNAERTYHPPRLVLPVSARDHIRGEPNANVTVVEYGDYQCPFCAAAHVATKELLDIEPVLFVYRHFPITTIHPLAEVAAEAAEAAGVQGAYWPMHDWIFGHQPTLSGPEDFLTAAGELGLDVDRIEEDMSTHRHERKIREDFMTGVRSGVNGTPTFFMNGERHDGGYDLDDLVSAVREVSPV